MISPTTAEIAAKIAILEGRPVLLQQDLARIYGVPARRLRRVVERHPKFFPGEFCFTPERADLCREGRDTRKAGDAFTLPGAMMAAVLLDFPTLLARSIDVAGAFEDRRPPAR